MQRVRKKDVSLEFVCERVVVDTAIFSQQQERFEHRPYYESWMVRLENRPTGLHSCLTNCVLLTKNKHPVTITFVFRMTQPYWIRPRRSAVRWDCVEHCLCASSCVT